MVEIDALTTLSYLLDLGESEAIMLAKNLNLPLIIDEINGRKIARQMGIPILGLLGTLIPQYQARSPKPNSSTGFLTTVRNQGLGYRKP